MAVEGNAPVDIAVDQLQVIDCPIAKLADENLTAIFKHLPPYERLLVSEVCSRWYEISRKAWLDLAELDLGPLPGRHIGAIVRQCPNLKSAFALKKSFDLNELACLSRCGSLATVKLFDCMFAHQSDPFIINDGFAGIFSRNLPQAPWDELVLHDALLARVAFSPGLPIHKLAFPAEHLPTTLTRLQLSGLRLRRGDIVYCEARLLDALSRLQGLECLMLHHTYYTPDVGQAAAYNVIPQPLSCDDNVVFQKLGALKRLRELAIGPVYEHTRVKDVVASLPKLEVLFLNDLFVDGFSQDLAGLVTENAVLRILVLSGSFYDPSLHMPVDIPARKRFPRGFDAAPLPLLHVFLGKQASEKFRFAKASFDAAIIHPINEPMPSFLEREDIAPIFAGVWLAEKIKETAKFGGKLWDYPTMDAANFVQFI